jgi:hypothetical protein
MEWTLMCILKASSLWKKKMKCNADQVEAQDQDKLPEDIICLKLGVHLVVMDMWRYFSSVSPIVLYGGAIRKTSPSKRNQER